MKDLLNYLLITVLVVLGGVFLINEMRILKDSPEPKNYNGYLSIELENRLIDLGFTYELEIRTGLYGYTYIMSSDIIDIRLYNVYIIDIYNNIGDYDSIFNQVNFIYINDGVNQEISITYNDDSLYNYMDVTGWVNDMKIMVVGKSNYEVQP